MADTLDNLIGIIFVNSLAGLFIFAALVQIRKTYRKFKEDENLPRWSKCHMLFKLIISSLSILFYLTADALFMINLLRWK